MKLKKRYIVLAVVAISAGAFGALSYSWTYTPYGRLDYAAALSTRALTIDKRMRPDPKSDFEFTMPINLLFAASATVLPKEQVSETRELAIPGDDAQIPARAYWPAQRNGAQALPIIVYYHGGGFVLGSVSSFDGLARSLANATKSVVVSVDYRLAPAHPYPSGVNDAYATLKWIAANAQSLGGDASRLAVAGDSAGGNLAAVVALKARDEGGPPIAAQILYYPVTDLTDTRYESKERFGDGYGLSNEAAATFHRAYIGQVTDRRDPYISPLYAPSVANLPPTLVLTGGFDPLTDSAKAFVERLKQSGVQVMWRNYADTIHGFMSVPMFPQRREALNATAEFWRGLTERPGR